MRPRRRQPRPESASSRVASSTLRRAAPLPGATVVVSGTASQTSSDRDGVFRLAAVPAGNQSVVVTYLGRKDEVLDVKVTAGAPAHLDVKMASVKFEESVTVQGDTLILESQERALNVQKTAPNISNVVSADQIGSFPDRNAAETTQRIPGVSITKDQGEGRYVNIRGTEPRLNSMMIDGQRIPSPDPLIRQVAVDVVPSELLQSIEVSKALTPDMDGDSIGGSVNLVMKQAPEKLRLFGSVGGGYNELLSSYGQSNYSVTAGRRFDGGKMGLIASASGSETTRGNQDMEVVYTPTLGLNELNPRWYQVDRRRVGFTGAFDVKPSNNSSVHGSRRVQSIHRRSREPSACPVCGRQPPHRSRAARPHAHRADLVAQPDRPADCRRFDHDRLPGARRLFRSARSVDDDDDVPAHERQLRAQCDARRRSIPTTSRPTRRTRASPTTTSTRSSVPINFAKDRDIVGSLNVRTAAAIVEPARRLC